MIRKSQLFLAFAGLIGMNAAMAVCNTTAWGAGATAPPGGAVLGGAFADGPVTTDANAAITHRYSGKCGLRANAAGAMVQDGTPLREGAYISRFYVLPNIATGEAVVFQANANEGADYPIFKVTFDMSTPATPAFKFYGGNGAGGFTAVPATITQVNGANIVANRWYMVETAYTRGAGTNGGTLSASVIGNRGNGSLTGTTPSTANLAAGTMILADAADGVDFVQMGWISGGTGTAVLADAFESRRSTAIGPLKRGDANFNNDCTSGDITQVLLEVNAITANNEPGLRTGQTDASENGSTTSGDATTVALLVNADTASGGTRDCGMPL